ncbi:hypothetical protein NDU88_003404 [Pleurodeles waltl]|uniref:Uncharacterized protein n=1 Tax=Pleurodeles waltl TaxID=8319 RepID=A0AAV7T4Z8_PLEWA|nr:hypothetical protein NDU88_003404 [Pleurodeles waltl]
MQAFTAAGPHLHRPGPGVSRSLGHLTSHRTSSVTKVLLPLPLISRAVRYSKLCVSATPLPARKLLSHHAPRTAWLRRARKQPRLPAPGAPIVPTSL